MTSPCSGCANSLRIRVNLSPEELSALDHDLRFEFGPFVVTPERAKELRTIVALADKDLEDHDRLHDSSVILRAQKQRLETQRAKLYSLLSPMRKLPNETLFRIFQHVCEENILQSYPWLLSDSPWTNLIFPAITYLPSMAISSVCYRWRALALSSPSLWANLSVKTHTTTLDKAEALVGFIDTITRYLERSGDWPLRLELTIQGPLIIRDSEIPCLTHLTQHACHWGTFRFNGTHSLVEYDILSELRFPLLVELELGWEVTLQDLDLFEHCPRLRTLSTSGPVRPTIGALYSQLDHFTSEGWTLTDSAKVLRRCPSLKSFELDCIMYDDLEEGALGTWPNITSIALVNSSSSDIVFSSSNFPCLNKLVVDNTSWRGGYGSTPFISRLARIITTFMLSSTDMSDVDLIAALRVMPALLHLEVNQGGWEQNPITSHLISSLTHHQSTSIESLVPKLHSLHWRFDSVDALDDSAFVSMVGSRWFKPGSDLSAEMLAMGKSCIRSVVLKFTFRAVDADIYKPLRILDAEGLRVVVAGTNGVQV